MGSSCQQGSAAAHLITKSVTNQLKIFMIIETITCELYSTKHDSQKYANLLKILKMPKVIKQNSFISSLILTRLKIIDKHRR